MDDAGKAQQRLKEAAPVLAIPAVVPRPKAPAKVGVSVPSNPTLSEIINGPVGQVYRIKDTGHKVTYIGNNEEKRFVRGVVVWLTLMN